MAQAFNTSAILARIRAAEMKALDDVGDSVASDARRRAPVRKVFKEAKGFRRRFRELTPTEKLLAIKRANAFYGADSFAGRRAVAHIRNYARAEVPRRGSANALKASRTLRVLGTIKGRKFTPRMDATRVYSRRRGTTGYSSPSLDKLLTSRGRYEVRSGRAIHLAKTAGGTTTVHVGGALKASIESEGAVQSGNGTVVRVTAGIRYAKFVEFPTIRTAAQPFLLPALHGHRQKLVQTLAAEVRKALGG